MDPAAEDFAQEIIREYLAVHHLKDLRAQFDAAVPRTNKMTRHDICNSLGIGKTYSAMKEAKNATLLAALTSQGLRRVKAANARRKPQSPPPRAEPEDMLFSKPVFSRPHTAAPRQSAPVSSDVIFEDVVEDVASLGLIDGNIQPGIHRTSSLSFATDPHTVSFGHMQDLSDIDLTLARQALFGKATGQFPASWHGGFPTYKDVLGSTADSVWWGLYQQEGGPCGVVACVQAMLIRKLFFHPNPVPMKTERYGQLTDAFTGAIADILLTAAGVSPSSTRKQTRLNGQVVLIVPKSLNANVPSPLHRPSLFSVVQPTAVSDLEAAVRTYGAFFRATDSSAIMSLTLSAVLSRGPENVMSDADEGTTPGLIGTHDYCTQGLVHLLLTGSAVSGVHDGNQDFDGYILHGIGRRGPVGVLTIYEHHGHMAVGPRMKYPETPVWVVFNESHYSVLWLKPEAHQMLVTKNYFMGQHRCFIYFDPLAHDPEYYQVDTDVGSDTPDGFVESLIHTLTGNCRFEWVVGEKLL
ncbi:protein of unknown function (DUF4205) [Carpediemonas membranifera]|uniref:Deubiquitinating enzyme MINDY-3/4 conserved domain-containing protein n=1 Tax=Carpediemonas membranifera TaxID=201153 RepID=A0A8J6AZX5_9EUKA|nr:protein of unknown function (DUF4205) [Carpediemonas membranifera]|eukprot:KAG9396335.1 protein of unknown function (DUF4205) [Carpediemonas membranifera]